MKHWRIPVWVLLPSLILIVAGLAIRLLVQPTPILVVRVQAELGILTLLAGVLLGVLSLGIWWFIRRWAAAIRRQAAGAERAAQAEAHLRFARRLNHELKNPLTAIRAGLANLEDTSPAAGQHGQTSRATIRAQVERLGRLTNDLRKLAELADGGVEMAPVDLAELIPEAVEMARSLPGHETRAITADVQRIPWSLSPVQGDRDLLLLALYNLLDNALKFSAAATTVAITAREDGSVVTLEVADQGCGIAPGDLPHVTEELYRGEYAQGVEGSGLGLALVERVAELHGGSFAIRSRAGQGTIATLRLPLPRK